MPKGRFLLGVERCIRRHASTDIVQTTTQFVVFVADIRRRPRGRIVCFDAFFVGEFANFRNWSANDSLLFNKLLASVSPASLGRAESSVSDPVRIAAVLALVEEPSDT